MNDASPEPPPLPPPPVPAETPPTPVSTGTVVLGVLALIAGLLLLIPGGLCSIMALGMLGGRSEEKQIGMMVGLIGLPALAVGIGLAIFGWRRLRRKSG